MKPVLANAPEHPSRPDSPVQRELRKYVDAFVGASTLSERADAWVTLVRWTRLEAATEEPSSKPREAFLSLGEKDEETRRFGLATAALFDESDGTIAFGHAGIPSERGFMAELGGTRDEPRLAQAA